MKLNTIIRNTFILSTLIAGILFAVDGGFSLPSRYEGMIIRNIEFVGINNVDADDLFMELDETDVDIGLPLKASEISKAIKLVFAAGQFENVIVEVEEYQNGVKLRFVCKERPVIKDIEFKGVEELSDIDLETALPVKEGEVLKLNLVEDSLKIIKDKYKEEGYFNSIIDYRIKEDTEDNSVNLTFIVDEGEEIKVEKISILGARKIQAVDLAGAMETNEDGWFQDGTFNKDIYEQDKGKIISYYKERGYLDAQIIEDNVEYEWEDPEKEEARGIFITIKVSEGEKYYFDSYTVEGNEVFKTEVFKVQFLQTDTGDIFNDTKFQMDRQMISFIYASKGYIFARVSPDRTVEEREVEIDGVMTKRKFVRIDFRITEGPQAYIENIIIKGNKKTKDKVIRRELIVNEGELFNSEKVQLSRERVYDLGFFKQVDFDVRPGSKEGYMNLIVDVEEQPTGTISLGGGYGTNSGFSIFADVGENNLLGNGYRVGVRVQYGPSSSSITLSFKNPWLFDYPVSFTTSVFYELLTKKTASMFSTGDYADYEKQSYGYSLGLSYRFWLYYGIGQVWNHAFKSYLNPSGNSPDEIFLEAALGVQDKRTMTFYVYRDSKDNYMNPTKGWRAEMAVGFTGGYLLRGDDHFITYSPDLSFYYTPFHLPYLKTHPCVVELRGSGKFTKPPFNKQKLQKIQNPDTNPWLESEDRMYIGGPETVRGWEYSVWDDSFQRSWQQGLYHRILYGAELRVPVHPQMLWIVLFFDAGSLWTDSFWEKSISEEDKAILDEDKSNGLLYDINKVFDTDWMPYFKYSWGFGFKIQIPMMPLRFWFGRKMIWVGQDQGFFKEISNFDFQFSIGDYRF